MNEHPLIQALKAAGPQTQRIAHSLTTPYYGHTISEAAWLADALVEDMTGHSALSDRFRAEDRDDTKLTRSAAKERTRLRTIIATTLRDFPDGYWDQFCTELAAGRGPQEADALVAKVDAAAAAMIRSIRIMADSSAIQTA
jgi:hypothetical protein